ncbi:MAG: cell division protein SepF [Thermoplasmata archaeon]|nr:MAG: cell division protein SepF [Thermoplasmata archaeon]
MEEVVHVVKRPFKKFKSEPPPGEPEKYIDLGEMYYDGDEMGAFPAKMQVKVAELHRYEDLGDLTNYVYNGNVLLLDFTPIANDNLTMRRITNELRSVSRDIGGDLAGVAKNMLIVTPEGVKVDRTKIKGPY